MFMKFTKRKNLYRNVLCRIKQIRWNHKWIPPQGHDTGIMVYSRIVKDKVPLVVSNKNLVKWYICGPTVYDVSHIGHASCYVRLDIIRRILEQFFDIRPIVALGITDIDDKIIKKGNATKTDFNVLAKKYELEFLKELNELNVLPPSFVLRVSDHLLEIIEFVSEIVKKGKGYSAEDGSVYFNTSAYGHYGKLNPVSTEGSSPLKKGQKHFLDFALWKGYKPNEPFWESPWGKGRPGWHIECSAMASKVFGSQIDLHSGGIDLVFPHHENEEAQSCCYHDCPQWVNYWIHTGLLEVKQEKMSKSFNNFISISEVLKKYTPDHVRMFCFMSSYRRVLHYGSDSMDNAVSMYNKVTQFLADSDSYIKGNWSKGNVSEATLMQELENTNKQVDEFLRDDFNTAGSFLSLMELIRTTVKMLNEEGDLCTSRSSSAVAAVSLYVNQMFKNFGFQLGSAAASQKNYDQGKLEYVINSAVNFRSQVRGEAFSLTEKPIKSNLFKFCDSFRDEMSTVGIVVKDQNKNKSTWILQEPKEEIKTHEVESAGLINK